MKYNITRIICKTLFLAVLMICSSVCVKANGPCDPFNPPPPEDPCWSYDPDNEVPIDGGASVLIAAGVAYGLKKVYEKRKQNKETDVA